MRDEQRDINGLPLSCMMRWLFSVVLLALVLGACTSPDTAVEQLVKDHALAWETGDVALLDSLLHEDVVFAYPTQRLNKSQALEDMVLFNQSFIDTRIYINKIIVDGSDVAVEWQFATTNKATGKRQVVSDAIIGSVKDGRIIVWKEYLDGRVKTYQANGTLSLE